MKFTDYIAQFLQDRNIKTVFGLTGGAVVHIFDSLDKYKKIETVFCHHEQTVALAAVANARVTNHVGAAVITTGPGGTNTVTGVTSAWQDSIPTIFIAGQARLEHCSRGKKVRQIGTQELDIISVVESITKYAAIVESPEKLKYHLQKAYYLATSGRPGPVWVDIPLNFQWLDINPEMQVDFDPAELETGKVQDNSGNLDAVFNKCFEEIKLAKRPLLIAGYGVRLSKAEKEFLKIVNKLEIPFVSTWTASDIVETSHVLYTGRLGFMGQRGGNLAVQNCDLLIAVGSHLSIPTTGTNTKYFAREAKKIMVDIDENEFDDKSFKIDIPVKCDAKQFLSNIIDKSDSLTKNSNWNNWRTKCAEYKKYNSIPAKFWNETEYVNSYVFMDKLSDMLNENDTIVVDGGGTNLFISFQGFKVKKGQRLTLSSGICAMGTGIPESIGACFASNKNRTICLTGDGSLQFNIQELQTIKHHKLPLKIFVLNNQGYMAIKHTQNMFLESKHIGSGFDGGISLPDFSEVGKAYGFETIRIFNNSELEEKMAKILNSPNPQLCEIMTSPDQELLFSQAFVKNPDGTGQARPLEDMNPLLDRDEFEKLMITKPFNFD